MGVRSCWIWQDFISLWSDDLYIFVHGQTFSVKIHSPSNCLLFFRIPICPHMQLEYIYTYSFMWSVAISWHAQKMYLNARTKDGLQVLVQWFEDMYMVKKISIGNVIVYLLLVQPTATFFFFCDFDQPRTWQTTTNQDVGLHCIHT